MKRANPFVDALLIAGIAGLVLVFCVRHGLLETSNKRLLMQRALARCSGWTKVTGNRFKEIDAIQEKQAREVTEKYRVPVTNTQDRTFRKYLMSATKIGREFDAEFNDGPSDLKIGTNLYYSGSLGRGIPFHQSFVCVHYDGRPEKLGGLLIQDEELKREILQCADELAAAILAVYR